MFEDFTPNFFSLSHFYSTCWKRITSPSWSHMSWTRVILSSLFSLFFSSSPNPSPSPLFSLANPSPPDQHPLCPSPPPQRTNQNSPPFPQTAPARRNPRNPPLVLELPPARPLLLKPYPRFPHSSSAHPYHPHPKPRPLSSSGRRNRRRRPSPSRGIHRRSSSPFSAILGPSSASRRDLTPPALRFSSRCP